MMKNGDRIMWDGIEWVRTGESASLACNGCENPNGQVTLFEAITPQGEKILARWCVECVKTALCDATCPNPDCFNLSQGRPEPVSLNCETGVCSKCGLNR